MRPLHPILGEPVQNAEIVAIRKGGATGRVGYFGLTRVDTVGQPKRHKGVDFLTGENDPVFAAHDGTVIRAGWQDASFQNIGYGLRVYLQSDDGLTVTVYAHLNHIDVRKGQKVVGGDLLGLAGRTGNVGTAPIHLHFEVRVGGVHVDPLPWLVKPAVDGAVVV